MQYYHRFDIHYTGPNHNMISATYTPPSQTYTPLQPTFSPFTFLPTPDPNSYISQPQTQ